MEDSRVSRLRQWIGEHNGSIADFCRAYGLSSSKASYLSQVLGGHRPLGERAARTLEMECGRPTNWLDIQPIESKGLRYDTHRVNQLAEADRDLIEGFIEFVLKRSEKRTGISQLNFEQTLESTPETKADLRRARKTSGNTSLNIQSKTARKAKRAA